MNEPNLSEVIARYLASEATADERRMVDEWAARDPANAADLAHMQSVWAARPAAESIDVDRAWKKVNLRMDRPTAITPTAGRSGPLLKIAAALVLVAGLAFGWRTFGPGSGGTATTYATKMGERQTIDLSDSTRVVLGPLSELKVHAKYGHSDRRVDLVGQAWFEVRHDSTRPFHVYALGTITEDLGTSFSVRASAADSVVHVVVAEGSASVRLAEAGVNDGAVLRANDAVELDIKSLKAHILRRVAVEPLTSWRNGRLDFENAMLSQVAAEFIRWYGLTMRFERPELATRHVSYSMPTDDLDEALKVLNASMVVQFERKGDTLIVR
jgi:transmembrane sensor